jgi:MATE family multidrug resistance protein
MAESRGRDDDLSLSNTLGQSLWLAALLSVPGMILCWILPDVLQGLGEPGGIVEQARLYLHSAAWCVLPTLWSAVIRSFATVIGRTRPIMVISTVSVAANLILCYALVLGGLGIAPIAVSGAGYARTIVSVLTLIAMMIYLFRSDHVRHFHRFRGAICVRPQQLWKILKLGLPAAGFTVIENSLFAAVGVLAGLFGAAALAASQIGLTVIECGVVIAFARCCGDVGGEFSPVAEC